MLLGGGRAKKEDIIDPAVGFILHKKKGDFVKAGESLATMHYNSETFPEEVQRRFLEAYTISSDKPQANPLIYEVIS